MRAIVVQELGEHATVQPLSSGGCGHCDSEGGCGSSNLSKMFCSSKPRQFTVVNAVQAKVGDEVQVTLPDGMLLRGAMKMYIWPLLLLLLGGMLGAGLAGGEASRDVYAGVGALGGLLLGFLLARISSGTGLAVASSIVSSRSGL
jgi:sigma-E factor negative regulatory protein RseC